MDEAHVCDAYNEGFNTLIEVGHVRDLKEPSYTAFAFMDCSTTISMSKQSCSYIWR
jgi:hypothetical protein